MAVTLGTRTPAVLRPPPLPAPLSALLVLMLMPWPSPAGVDGVTARPDIQSGSSDGESVTRLEGVGGDGMG